MPFVQTFLVPIVSLCFLGGIISWISFVSYREISRLWKQQTKWIFKYKVMRKSYPEKTIAWCLGCFDEGIGYYDAKKLLLVKNGNNLDQVYETLYIYDQLISELHSKNNIMTKEERQDGRKYERSYSEVEAIKLPERNSENTTKTN